MGWRVYTASALAVIALLAAPARAQADGRKALVPMERDASSGALPLSGGGVTKADPGLERVRIQKQDISSGDLVTKKDPLVVITSPKTSVVTGAFQAISCRVGGGIAKAFLRINDDNQVVSVTGGTFEVDGALRPGLNLITVIAWDLDGNIGKDSLKVFYRQDEEGPEVGITGPADGTSFDITGERVVTVKASTDAGDASEGVLIINNIPRRVGFRGGVMEQEVALLPSLNEIYVEVTDSAGRTGRSNPVRLSTFDARPKDLVAVLSWDSPTADLDLHVWDSFGHHTFNDARDPFECDAAIPRGSLDMDRKGGYGPEVFSLEAAEPEVYTFYAKYSPGIKDDDRAGAYLRLLLHGDEPSRRILRCFGPVRMSEMYPVWEAAHVKMPEGVFFQEKDSDLVKTLGMDEKAVRRLALMLDEENPAFRLAAISAMGQIKSEEAVGPLLAALARGETEVRRAAVGALWNIRSVASLGGLVRALTDPDPEVRQAAAGALGELESPDALFPLTGLLSEESDTMVKIEAIRALGGLGDPRSYDSLVSLVRDTDPRVRVETARALGKAGEPRAAEALAAMLADDVGWVREVAAGALGTLGRPGSAKPLMDVLRFDQSDGARAHAAVALGRLREPSAKAELETAAERDSSPRVRSCAARALESLVAPSAPGPAVPRPAVVDDDLVVN
ncbi:MAG: HEAT repeat domain-containing protein [Nitrospirae bacterium]|nr:HEAT repeat domain-containing protein [Nitrospirota bacterium]